MVLITRLHAQRDSGLCHGMRTDWKQCWLLDPWPKGEHICALLVLDFKDPSEVLQVFISVIYQFYESRATLSVHSAICTFTAYVPRPIYVHAMHSLISNLQMRKQRNQLFPSRQTQQGNIEKTFIWKKTKNATDFQELLHTSIWKAALAALPSFLFYPPKFCNKTTLQIQFLKLPNKTPITY